MISLENSLEISLQDVFKMSWRSLEDVLKMSWRRFWKTSGRRFEDALTMPWRRLENLLETSWRRLEDVLRTYGQDDYWPRRLEDVLKRSFEDVMLRRINLFWSRCLHQDKCLLGFNHMQRHFFAETQILSSQDIIDKLEHIFSRTQRFG